MFECGELGPEDLLVELEEVAEVVLPQTRVPDQHIYQSLDLMSYHKGTGPTYLSKV